MASIKSLMEITFETGASLDTITPPPAPLTTPALMWMTFNKSLFDTTHTIQALCVSCLPVGKALETHRSGKPTE